MSSNPKTYNWRNQVIGQIPMLRSEIRSLVRDPHDAEDVLQQPLIKALQPTELTNPQCGMLDQTLPVGNRLLGKISELGFQGVGHHLLDVPLASNYDLLSEIDENAGKRIPSRRSWNPVNTHFPASTPLPLDSLS